VGASFEQMDMGTPGVPQQSANAVIAGVNYDHHIETAANQEIAAGYDLHLAGHGLGGDYHYSRHRSNLRYTVAFGRNSVTDEALAGVISGDAPLYDRFVLGTSSLLRGWNRYEIDPLGGNRVLYNSVDYSFRLNPGGDHARSIQLFYDAGAIWNQGQAAPVRESAGIGYRQSIFSLALAFPLHDGHIDPVFMVGMNY
jgi:hemolysin activation/secretion protein